MIIICSNVKDTRGETSITPITWIEKKTHILYWAIRMVLLVLLIAFEIGFMGAQQSFADSNIASGISGTCQWVIDGDGVLTISAGTLEDWGHGSDSPMYSDNGPQWERYNHKIREVKTTGTVVLLTGHNLFSGNENMTSVDLSGFDTSKVTDMSGMFYDCRSLKKINVSGFDTSKVTDMSWMFYLCAELTSLNVSGFDTSNVMNMRGMFLACNSLTSLNVSGFDTSKVTDMWGMFDSCIALPSLNLSVFDTSNVMDMGAMFLGCNSLTSLNVSGFDTSKVTNMRQMFDSCIALPSLNLSVFDTSKVTDMRWMFNCCDSLKNLALGSKMAIKKDVMSDEPIVIGGVEKWIRYTTLDGTEATGPVLNTLTDYDGSNPGWYKPFQPVVDTPSPTPPNITTTTNASALSALRSKYNVPYKGRLKLKIKTNGKLTFKSSKKRIASVSKKGVIAGKKYGKTKIAITEMIGGKVRKKVITVTVVPRKAKIKSVKCNSRSATIKLSKKDKTATGYQVYASNTGDFADDTISTTVSTRQVKKHCLTLKMPKKKYLFFMVRAYKKLGGKKLYGAWSYIAIAY